MRACAEDSCAKTVCRECKSRWVAADRKRAAGSTLVKKNVKKNVLKDLCSSTTDEKKIFTFYFDVYF